MTELTAILKQLTQLHERFNEQALEKRDAVKVGDMQGLETIMKTESALIQELRKLEKMRQVVTSSWLESRGLVKENVTVEEILTHLGESDREEMSKWQTRLVEQIQLLKEKNELNEQLIQESLRFVNMSLDAVQPQRETENYTRPNQQINAYDTPQSLFDSKA
ncbi:flagellar protein FlgN [Alteribacter populi]|uniref:flagellar protein FlgN n=1 Tax=Alteribacter populi TaxID=2011011 RepID=UPI0012FE5165|nr:flagellar protein FlgN [Alteribacter populi]